jgi:hypothetical protein
MTTLAAITVVILAGAVCGLVVLAVVALFDWVGLIRLPR